MICDLCDANLSASPEIPVILANGVLSVKCPICGEIKALNIMETSSTKYLVVEE